MTALEGLTGAKDDYFCRRRKMEHSTRLLTISALFMCFACAGGQDLSRYDLSTDEGLMAARGAVIGKQLGAYSKGCVRGRGHREFSTEGDRFNLPKEVLEEIGL